MHTKAPVENLLWRSIDGSLREFFSMMVGAELGMASDSIPQPAAFQSLPSDTSDITVIVGWTGDLQGVIAISLTEASALRVTSALIDHETNAIDQTVIDAIGELGNIVVGGAKRRMTDHQMKMSLPSVIRTGSASLAYPSQSHPKLVQYDFAGTPLQVIVAVT